jgi:chemotaxis protein methyltransferase WspC
MSYPLVRRWLMEHTALEPSLLEGAGFDALVAGRLAACGAADDAGYAALLDRSPDEVDQLVAGIAVPETWLFRYPRSFEVLAEFAARRLAEGRPELRLCSVGCATGQEPYCMAMAALHAGWPADRVHIEALDRSAELLRTAAAAEYGPASIRTEIPAWALPHLQRRGEHVVVDPAVRAMVRFTCADATAPGVLGAFAPFDAVFCRNVLIYLTSAARARLLSAICEALTSGGMLVVGHAEHSMRGDVPLRAVAARHAFALERVEARAESRVPSAELVGALGTRHPALGTSDAVAPRALPPISRPTPMPAPAALEPEETIDDACALADAGRIQDAERSVRGIMARRGPSARAFELLGMIRLAARDSAGARRLFEQALYLEPERPLALLQLAIISESSGDSRRTAALWERVHRASAREARP